MSETTSNNPLAQPRRADAWATASPTIRRFLGELLAFYERGRGAEAASLAPPAVEQRLAALMLAEAAMRLLRPAATRGADRPPQLAVLGPTQTGKSTIVNVLLGQRVAEVSPLAGFTVHPQGFWTTPAEAQEIGRGTRAAPWLNALLPGWQRCEADALRRENLSAYALTRIKRAGASDGAQALADARATLPAGVIWDTPDFDSLAAHEYRRAVLEIAALADAYLLVLSKEKYSDLAVWNILRLLEPLGRPLVICVNKLLPEEIEPITAAVRRRLDELGAAWGDVPIVRVEHCPGLGACGDASVEQVPNRSFQTQQRPVPQLLSGALGEDPERALSEAVAGLRCAVAARLETASYSRQAVGVRAFIRQHWDAWTAPIRGEHAALEEWNRVAEAALDALLESYRRDYLEHPQRYDSFRRAIAELLDLLELPGLGSALRHARQVVTWPVRKLFGAGRAWWESRRSPRATRGLGSAEGVLFDALETLLTSVQRDVTRRCQPDAPGYAVWRALAQRLETDEPRLRESFQTAAREHQAEVAREIHVAATRLYETLRQRPVLLNTLRVARATADVVSVALAVKTGGLHFNDLVFAPAMFALTSVLTEGALGAYMRRVADELKQRQLEHLRAFLVEGVFAPELQRCADNLERSGLFGISPEQLEQTHRALDEWEHADVG